MFAVKVFSEDRLIWLCSLLYGMHFVLEYTGIVGKIGDVLSCNELSSLQDNLISGHKKMCYQYCPKWVSTVSGMGSKRILTNYLLEEASHFIHFSIC